MRRAVCLSAAPVLVAFVGCSAMLDYDQVTFSKEDAGEDVSTGTGGAGGSGGDASWEGKAGGAGLGGAQQGGSAGAGGGEQGGASGAGGGAEGGGGPAGAGGAPPSCAGIDCGAQGACVIDGPVARCQCNPGYHPEGFTCVADASCDGIGCSGHGQCTIYGGKQACICDAGFHAAGLECVENVNEAACQGIDCSGHGACLVDPVTGPKCHCEVGYHLATTDTNCQPAAGSLCDGVSCGGSGTCKSMVYHAQCSCDPGYMAYGMFCVAEGKLGCRDVDNSFQPRGSRRCSADDTRMEVCWDGDNDGKVEWVDGQVTCPNGEKCSVCSSYPCLASGYAGKECPEGKQCVPCPIGTQCVPEAHSQPLYVCVPKCDCGNCPNCTDPAYFQDWQEYCGNPNSSPATMACTVPCASAGDGCLPWGADSICWGMEGCFSAAP